MLITPICFYPTTLIAVDDNESYLKSLDMCLAHEIPYKVFSNPDDAVEFLNNDYQMRPFITSLVKEEETGCATINFQFELQNIASHIYDADRFNEISIVLIDYSMPEMTGVEFCKKTPRDYMRTIMLTGEAGYSVAVDAFNKGLITQFLLKDNRSVVENVLETIKYQQKNYFLELSKFILQDASDNDNVEEIKKVLSDKTIATLLDQYIQRFDIVEYYLLNIECDFLLIDADGNSHVFVVKSESLMHSFEELARYGETASEELANKVIDSLYHRKQAPYFYDDSCYQSTVDEWINLLHPAQKVIGDHDTYYCALLEYCDDLPIKLSRELTFFSDVVI